MPLKQTDRTHHLSRTCHGTVGTLQGHAALTVVCVAYRCCPGCRRLCRVQKPQAGSPQTDKGKGSGSPVLLGPSAALPVSSCSSLVTLVTLGQGQACSKRGLLSLTMIPAEPRSLREDGAGKPIILTSSLGIVLKVLPEVRADQRVRSIAGMTEKPPQNTLWCPASRWK